MRVDRKGIIIFTLLTVFSFTVLLYISFNLLVFSGDYKDYLGQYLYGGGERFEIGYRILIDSYSLLFKNKTEIQLVTFISMLSILTFLSKASVIYFINRKSLLSFIFCYLIYFFILHEINQIRLSIAIGVSIWTLYFLMVDRKIVAVMLCLIGVLFHYTAILFFIPIIISIMRLYNKPFKLVFGIMIIVILVIGTINSGILNSINPLFERYSESSVGYKFNGFYIAVLVLFLMLSIKAVDSTISKVTYYSSVILFIISFVFLSAPVVAVRIMDLSALFMLITAHVITFRKNFFVLSSYGMIFILSLSKFLIFMTANETIQFSSYDWINIF